VVQHSTFKWYMVQSLVMLKKGKNSFVKSYRDNNIPKVLERQVVDQGNKHLHLHKKANAIHLCK